MACLFLFLLTEQCVRLIKGSAPSDLSTAEVTTKQGITHKSICKLE